MLTEWIQDYLANEKDEGRDPRRIGISSIGHCGRQLAYKYHGVAGDPLPWRSRSIFADGNYIQDQLRYWIHLSVKPDCYYLTDEEAEVTLKTPKGHEIKGHLDGIIRHLAGELTLCRNPDHYSRLLEIKSMGSTSWRINKREGLDRSYQAQVSGYLKATGLKDAVVLMKNKDTSDLREIVMTLDEKLLDERLAIVDQVLDSTTPDMVQREWRANDDGELPWHCGYCPYVRTCWKDFKPREVETHKWVLDGDYRQA